MDREREFDPDVFDAAEAIVVRRRGPLTRTTSPEAWLAYWADVDAELVRLSAGPVVDGGVV